MHNFELSAPGAICLYGDSVIMYKMTCVGASIGLYTRLTFKSLCSKSIERDFIEFEYSNINLHIRVPLMTFLAYFFHENVNRNAHVTRIRDEVESFVNSLRRMYIGMYEPNNRNHLLSLRAFFFLLVLISYTSRHDIKQSFVVKVSTELAIGQGLGSSASLAVCFAACFLRWSILQKGIAIEEWDMFGKSLIIEFAAICDSIIFNAESKLKAVVSTCGSVVAFNEGKVSRIYLNIPNMKIMLVFSNFGVRVPTVKEIQRYVLKHSITVSILNIVENISKMSVQTFNMIEKKRLPLPEMGHLFLPYYEKLSEFLRMNQEILCAIYMVHPNTKLICAIAQKYLFAGKSISINKSAFILLPPNITDEIIIQLMSEFNSFNMIAILTSLCCDGLRLTETI
ncbi:mevalonate kinase-like [Pogonomyrmex barbatus]|uniref:Mevalonate kinase-like n=1 Tax=Pogonomyrmex barbatus TaxID=144034 RepID=A0A6I9WI98_9HYME|nr:mevalonate kinase-like [Pogonomyrmex barbatus]